MSHSTKAPTKAQQKRMDALSEMRCVCCEIEGIRQPNPTEVHHLVDNGYRKHSGGHDSTLPLCAYHHRGIYPSGMTADEMLFECGPSLALHKRKFIEAYGTERELLAKIDAALGDAG